MLLGARFVAVTDFEKARTERHNYWTKTEKNIEASARTTLDWNTELLEAYNKEPNKATLNYIYLTTGWSGRKSIRGKYLSFQWQLKMTSDEKKKGYQGISPNLLANLFKYVNREEIIEQITEEHIPVFVAHPEITLNTQSDFWKNNSAEFEPGKMDLVLAAGVFKKILKTNSIIKNDNVFSVVVTNK